jgi:hypothetical protein
MATMQDLLDDLNDRLQDANNAAGVGEATKMRYINRGVAAMWPRIFRTVSDATIELVADTYEYAIPSAVGDESEIFRVEIEDINAASTRYVELDNFDIVPVLTTRYLQLPYIPSHYEGAHIRITAAKPLSRMAAVGTTFDGRQIHEELPVWYALGLALARNIENRTDHTRYTTTDGRNGVDINEQIGSAGWAFAQFESMLERMAMPWPASVG